VAGGLLLGTDGHIWLRPGKKLKPIFDRPKIADLSFLKGEIDTLTRNLLEDGSLVDPQPFA
jgi:hypothetical protein